MNDSNSSHHGSHRQSAANSRFVMKPVPGGSRRGLRSTSLVGSSDEGSIRECHRSYSLQEGSSRSTNSELNVSNFMDNSISGKRKHLINKGNQLPVDNMSRSIKSNRIDPSNSRRGSNQMVKSSLLSTPTSDCTHDNSSLSSVDSFVGEEKLKSFWNPDDETSVTTNNTDNLQNIMLVLPNVYQQSFNSADIDDDEVISLNPRLNRSVHSGSSSGNSSRSQRSSMSAWTDALKRKREKERRRDSQHSYTHGQSSTSSHSGQLNPDSSSEFGSASNSSINSFSCESNSSRSRRSSMSAWSASQQHRQEQQRLSDSQHSNKIDSSNGENSSGRSHRSSVSKRSESEGRHREQEELHNLDHSNKRHTSKKYSSMSSPSQMENMHIEVGIRTGNVAQNSKVKYQESDVKQLSERTDIVADNGTKDEVMQLSDANTKLRQHTASISSEIVDEFAKTFNAMHRNQKSVNDKRTSSKDPGAKNKENSVDNSHVDEKGSRRRVSNNRRIEGFDSPENKTNKSSSKNPNESSIEPVGRRKSQSIDHEKQTPSAINEKGLHRVVKGKQADRDHLQTEKEIISNTNTGDLNKITPTKKSEPASSSHNGMHERKNRHSRTNEEMGDTSKSNRKETKESKRSKGTVSSRDAIEGDRSEVNRFEGDTKSSKHPKDRLINNANNQSKSDGQGKKPVELEDQSPSGRRKPRNEIDSKTAAAGRRSKTPDSPRKGTLRRVLQLRRQKSQPVADDDDCSSKHGGESVVSMLSGIINNSSVTMENQDSPHKTDASSHHDSKANLKEESLSLLELIQPRHFIGENSKRSTRSGQHDDFDNNNSPSRVKDQGKNAEQPETIVSERDSTSATPSKQTSKDCRRNSSQSPRRQRNSHNGDTYQSRQSQKRESGRHKTARREREKTTKPDSSSQDVASAKQARNNQDCTSANSPTKQSGSADSSDRSSVHRRRRSNRELNSKHREKSPVQQLSRISSINTDTSSHNRSPEITESPSLDLGDVRGTRGKSMRRSLDIASSHSQTFESHSVPRHQSMPVGEMNKDFQQLADSTRNETPSRNRRNKNSEYESCDIQKTRKRSINSLNQRREKDSLKISSSFESPMSSSDQSTQVKGSKTQDVASREKPIVPKRNSASTTSLLLNQKTRIAINPDTAKTDETSAKHQLWLQHVKTLRDLNSNSRRSSATSRKGSLRIRSRSADFFPLEKSKDTVPVRTSRRDSSTSRKESKRVRSKSADFTEATSVPIEKSKDTSHSSDHGSSSSLSRSSGSKRSVANGIGLHLNNDKSPLNLPWTNRKKQLLDEDHVTEENSVDLSLDLGDIKNMKVTGKHENELEHRQVDSAKIKTVPTISIAKVTHSKIGEVIVNDEDEKDDSSDVWAHKLTHKETMIKSTKKDHIDKSSNSQRIHEATSARASHNDPSCNATKLTDGSWTPLVHKSKFDVDSPKKTPISIRQSLPTKQSQNHASSSKFESPLKSAHLHGSTASPWSQSSETNKKLLLQRHLDDSVTIISGDLEGLTDEQRAWVGIDRVLKDSKYKEDDQESSICTRDVLPEAIILAMLNFHESGSVASSPCHVFHDASDSPKENVKQGWHASLRSESSHKAGLSAEIMSSSQNLGDFMAAKTGGDDSSLPPLVDIDTMTIQSSGTASVVSFLSYLTTHRNVIVQDDQDIEKKDQAIKMFLIEAFNHLLPEGSRDAIKSGNDRNKDVNDTIKAQLNAIDPKLIMQLLELLNSQIGNAQPKSPAKPMGKIPETVMENEGEETEESEYGQSQQLSLSIEDVFDSSKRSVESSSKHRNKSNAPPKILERHPNEDEQEEPDDDEFFGKKYETEFDESDLPNRRLTMAVTDKINDVSDFNNSMPSLTSVVTNDVATIARPATKWNSEGDLDYHDSPTKEDVENEGLLFETDHENEIVQDYAVEDVATDESDNTLDDAPPTHEFAVGLDANVNTQTENKAPSKLARKGKMKSPNGKKKKQAKKKKPDNQQNTETFIDPLAVDPEKLQDFFKTKDPPTPKTNNKKQSVMEKFNRSSFPARQGIDPSSGSSVSTSSTAGAREFKRKNYDSRSKFWSLKAGLSSMSSIFSMISGGGKESSAASTSTTNVQGRGDARFFPDDEIRDASSGNLLSLS